MSFTYTVSTPAHATSAIIHKWSPANNNTPILTFSTSACSLPPTYGKLDNGSGASSGSCKAPWHDMEWNVPSPPIWGERREVGIKKIMINKERKKEKKGKQKVPANYRCTVGAGCPFRSVQGRWRWMVEWWGHNSSGGGDEVLNGCFSTGRWRGYSKALGGLNIFEFSLFSEPTVVDKIN